MNFKTIAFWSRLSTERAQQTEYLIFNIIWNFSNVFHYLNVAFFLQQRYNLSNGIKPCDMFSF